MTVDKKDVVTIPKWLVIVILPLLVSILGSLVTVATAKANLESGVDNNEKQINKLFEQKTDRNEQALIMKSLERIESKLDDHLKQHGK